MAEDFKAWMDTAQEKCKSIAEVHLGRSLYHLSWSESAEDRARLSAFGFSDAKVAREVAILLLSTAVSIAFDDDDTSRSAVNRSVVAHVSSLAQALAAKGLT